MKLEDIGFYTLSDWRASQSTKHSSLWRCELLLTNKCNFKCPYCRDNDNPLKSSLPFPEAINILEYWCNHRLKHLRLSGGEPTLYPNLIDLVVYAKNRGVERIALSTNGSASLNLYERLIDAGVNDLSVSLDACCSSFGQEMCGGVKGAWEKVVENIRELSKLTYVTVGMVFSDKNISQARESIEFASSLGVADIRVISSAQYNQAIEALQSLPEHILEKHPILKYRVNNHKAGIPIRGLLDDDSHKCPLVLDDMAVRDGKHYPCIIYLREGGKPIGEMDNNIRDDRYSWYLKHNTSLDGICKQNCLDVCRQYNNTYELFHQARNNYKVEIDHDILCVSKKEKYENTRI